MDSNSTEYVSMELIRCMLELSQVVAPTSSKLLATVIEIDATRMAPFNTSFLLVDFSLRTQLTYICSSKFEVEF